MTPVFISTWWHGINCIETASKEWSCSGNLLDCVEVGIAAVEFDPTSHSVGLGGLPNADGEVELDAAIMVGDTLAAGGVAGVRNILPVISVARRVMEDTPHIMLVGDNAQRFAISKGFEPRPLLTDHTINRWHEWQADPEAELLTGGDGEPENHDTICLLAMHEGHFIAGTSSSGKKWKIPGRVGDSPIFGAGLYADDQAGAAAATGVGEEIWRFVMSYQTVQNMRMGMSAQQACEASIKQMLERKPDNNRIECGVIAIDRQGNPGSATTWPDFIAPALVNGKFNENKVKFISL
ncbi:MAG: N(4)-(beta-N-acetylglucosaminyl)-L-asparaginase [bacterium]